MSSREKVGLPHTNPDTYNLTRDTPDIRLPLIIRGDSRFYTLKLTADTPPNKMMPPRITRVGPDRRIPMVVEVVGSEAISPKDDLDN